MSNCSPETDLFVSVIAGNSERIQHILGDPVNRIVDRDGQNALHLAVTNFDPDQNGNAVQTLLALGADPNAQDKMGRTALHSAAIHGHDAVMKELLCHPKVNPNVGVFSDGFTALQFAAHRRHIDVVKEMLNHPATNPDIQDDQLGRTALHQAAEVGSVGTVKELLRGRADPNIQDKYGETALHLAVIAGQKDVVKELLLADDGVDPNLQNSMGDTALHLACEHGVRNINRRKTQQHLTDYSKILEYLLHHPAIDLNKRSHNLKTTPLASALHCKCFSVARKLIQRGAAVTNLDKHQSTALHIAVENIFDERHVAFLDELLSHEQIDINQEDRYGRTALMRASEGCSSDDKTEFDHHLKSKGIELGCYGENDEALFTMVLQYLVEKGARTDVRDSEEDTALHFFCRRFRIQEPARTIDALLRDNPDIVNSSSNWGNPLELALDRGFQEIATDLIQRKGTNVNIKARDYETEHTPLHIVCKRSAILGSNGPRHYAEPMLGMVKLLVERGANVNELDVKGNTPLHLACTTRLECVSTGGDWEVIKYLLGQEGIQLHKLNARGFTPLMAAAHADAPLELLFQILTETGGTALDCNHNHDNNENNEITNKKKRSHSSAFEEYDTDDDEWQPDPTKYYDIVVENGEFRCREFHHKVPRAYRKRRRRSTRI